MKKNVILVAVAAMMATSCGMGTTSTGTTGAATTGSILGDVLSGVIGGGAVDAIASVIGLDKLTKESLHGTWHYSNPGCAFMSEQLLAKAGGEVAAAQIKEKMKPTFDRVGVNSSNTFVQFNADNTFSASIAGKQFSGTYTFDVATRKVTMQTLLLNINCYAKKNVSGIALLFEASKLLTVLQTMSALSGNATLTTIGDLSKNYDGVRLGFDFK